MLMKGPSGRIKYHAHRYWTCPRCGYTLRTGGEVVTAQCPACIGTFSSETCWMALVESKEMKPITVKRSTPQTSAPEQPDGEISPSPDK
jgi:hypothetical protein